MLALAGAGMCDTITEQGPSVTSVSSAGSAGSQQAFFASNPDAVHVGTHLDLTDQEKTWIIYGLAGAIIFLLLVLAVT